jgi:rhodanese-related sulfurtransferase
MLSYQEYVKLIQQDINEIDVETYYKNLNKQNIIIDVREPSELNVGKITGALNIPRGMLEAKLLSLSSLDNIADAQDWLMQQNILLYCASGARSALATKSLLAMGLKNVSSLSGGFAAWLKLGYPVVHAA